MPMKTVHCRICHKAIKGSSFKARMSRLRHHYKASHPSTWKQSIRRGAAKRKIVHGKRWHDLKIYRKAKKHFVSKRRRKKTFWSWI